MVYTFACTRQVVLTFFTRFLIFSRNKSFFARAYIQIPSFVTNLTAAAFSFFITRMYWNRRTVLVCTCYLRINEFIVQVYVCIRLRFYWPFLQVLLSFFNINPTSQEHSCFSFLLLQIWLQPPFFSSSQGCTK